MGADVPWGGAILNPRDIIGKIYVSIILHCCILKHAKYTSFGSCSFREDFSYVSFYMYKPKADNDVPGAWPVWTPGAWPVWTPGAWLSDFIKRIT